MVNLINIKTLLITLLLTCPVGSSNLASNSVKPMSGIIYQDTIESPLEAIVEPCDNICYPEEKCVYGLDNDRDIRSFMKYIKTQSNRINTSVGKRDVFFVMQTILNRLRHKKCTWREYYNTPSLNNSQSIKRMRDGTLKKYYNHKNHRDQILYDMFLQCKLGQLEPEDKIPDDVLYFESFRKPRNRAPHLNEKLYCKARHRFYTL